MVKYFFEQMDLLAVSLTANAGFLSGTVRPGADLKWMPSDIQQNDWLKKKMIDQNPAQPGPLIQYNKSQGVHISWLFCIIKVLSSCFSLTHYTQTNTASDLHLYFPWRLQAMLICIKSHTQPCCMHTTAWYTQSATIQCNAMGTSMQWEHQCTMNNSAMGTTMQYNGTNTM